MNIKTVYLVMKPRTATLLLFEAYPSRNAAIEAGTQMFGKGKFTVTLIDIIDATLENPKRQA